jgi:glucoamylase
MEMRPVVLLACIVGVLASAPGATAARGVAPGGPGAPAVWTPADKEGFGTSTTVASKVWHTLERGTLTEVYYPDLGTPAVRDLQFVVSDGRTFSELERDATDHRVELADPRSLTYRQVNTARSGRYRITKTYVTDPATSTLLIRVRFESFTKRELSLYALYDPSLSNNGMDDSGATQGADLIASDSAAASALSASPSFNRTSNGYLGTSDGWQDLKADHRMDWTYRSAPNGNVVQTGRLPLTGRSGAQDATLTLGFGAAPSAAVSAARSSLARGFDATAAAYARGWHAYLGSIKPAPAPAVRFGPTYDVSTMTLAAHEDKTFRGAYIASPTMPWVWGQGLENPSGAYHLVWSRDLYQIATSLLAAGDRGGAERALTYLFQRQQKPDGSFPQNSTVDGTPHWTNLQMDEVAFPIVLAWQLGRSDGATYANHVKKAADFIVANGPSTPQERWENQGGWSPATIASEVAALVCAADIARRNGDPRSAATYERTADAWQRAVDGWTATTNGPYAPRPYYLRLTKDAQPNSGTKYSIGDGGPSAIDQRAVVDPSFLELVRLGLKRPDDHTVRNTIAVVDSQLGVGTPNGTFWHRFNHDGYGETREGGPWDISPPDTFRTLGRAWPIFAGERGEYEVAAGRPAQDRLAAMAGSANGGYMMPEQVWDQNPPSGRPGFPRGEGTFSATPLAWSHAQFVRLAWSMQTGKPVERPAIVACRYTRECR